MGTCKVCGSSNAILTSCPVCSAMVDEHEGYAACVDGHRWLT